MSVNESAQLQTTPLHVWHGIVAADKAPNSITIQVLIQELTPAAVGTVAPASSNQSVKLKDLDGNPINSSVTTGNTITAYYLGNSSNRRYPPDVVKGEQVRVSRLANSDKYYWESLGRDDALRKTETHRIDVANRSSDSSSSSSGSGGSSGGSGSSSGGNNNPPLDDSSTYSVELDTKVNQHIRIQTSKGNGEKFAYVMKLDGKNGLVQLSDDAGNSITIDSGNSKVMLRNTKKSFVLLNGEDIIIAAPRDITLKAGRQALITSPLITISAEGGSAVLALIASYISQSAKSAATTASPAIGLNGAVQVPSSLTARVIKAGTYYNGYPSAAYPEASINLGSATATIASVTPDTQLPATQRHAAAWEDVSDAMGIIKGCFDDIQARIGAPTNQLQIPPLATSSQMGNLKGT